MDMVDVVLESTLKCPNCGYQKAETMPTDSCLYFYECESCHVVLKPQQYTADGRRTPFKRNLRPWPI
ncbi:GDCCVxC domain-containing (seleno)protein [Marinobacter changyiensis]|uniref:GDCCVxC domain-containing (seleno)protein n=1 Tax=Marinobacter changyiensis TaxID=2604091 RepID=UPI0031B63560